METTNLYIPVNIKTRFEFFSGYGFTELIPTIVTAAVCGLIAFIVHGTSGELALPAVLTLGGIAASVMAQTRDDTNQSVVTHTKRLLRYMRGQQLYKFKYLNEWSIAK